MKGSSHTVCGLWTNAFLLIGFALLHSGLAACGFFRSFAGPLHRCLYNVTTCAYILVSSSGSVCMYVCLCVLVYMCRSACMCVCVFVCWWVCTARMCVHVYVVCLCVGGCVLYVCVYMCMLCVCVGGCSCTACYLIFLPLPHLPSLSHLLPPSPFPPCFLPRCLTSIGLPLQAFCCGMLPLCSGCRCSSFSSTFTLGAALRFPSSPSTIWSF